MTRGDTMASVNSQNMTQNCRLTFHRRRRPRKEGQRVGGGTPELVSSPETVLMEAQSSNISPTKQIPTVQQCLMQQPFRPAVHSQTPHGSRSRHLKPSNGSPVGPTSHQQHISPAASKILSGDWKPDACDWWSTIYFCLSDDYLCVFYAQIIVFLYGYQMVSINMSIILNHNLFTFKMFFFT